MQALVFGDSRQPLFGMHHAPAEPARRTAILICPPWGTEYMRAYRGLRQLAVQLARAGYPVLRFDYRGTGDSAGEVRDIALADWVADIVTAAAELRRVSGVPYLAVFGLRFGALLAQQALADGLAADALLVWDAPPSGEVYMDNLRHLDQATSDARNRYRAPRAQLPEAGGDELLGYAWPRSLDPQVAALPGLRDDLAASRLVFVSRDRTPPENVDSLRLPDASHWSDSTRLHSPWNPGASISATVEQLETTLP